MSHTQENRFAYIETFFIMKSDGKTNEWKIRFMLPPLTTSLWKRE